MSEQTINQLGKTMKELLKAIEGLSKQLIEPLQQLNKLPDFFKGLRDVINTTSNNQIQALGEMEIHKRMAEIKAQQQYVLGENEVIEEFKQQLEEDLLRIDERYKKIDDKLVNECRKRIRELDAHLLDFPLSFPADLMEGVTQRINPLINELMIDANASYEIRVEFLKTKTQKTIETIENFLAIRKELLTQIENYQQNEIPDKDMEYYLPVWIIETSKSLNQWKTETNTFLPGSFARTDENSDFQFDCLKPVSEIQSKLDNIHYKHIKDGLIKDVEMKTSANLTKNLEDGINRLLKKNNIATDARLKAYKKFINQSTIQTT